ncbi:hypothetical protein ABZP36_013844 [Zizania latifolia]
MLAEAKMSTKCPVVTTRNLSYSLSCSSSSCIRSIANEFDGSRQLLQGKVSLISINALHQLHIFIFFLAVFHVTYSAITMALGRAKACSVSLFFFLFFRVVLCCYSGNNFEPLSWRRRCRFVDGKSGRKKPPAKITSSPMSNFFRQFFRSVRRADYCALRHSFVNVSTRTTPPLWASALIFLLLNVSGLHAMLWISIMPVVTILSVGTKLQGIICRMAIDITERHAVIQGIPLVQVSDSYFWFSRPTFVLFLIHFTLFQNGFQIIYFLWILYEYGMDSCFNDSKEFVFARLCLGVVVQFLCSYVTLPLYALVSQMGSTMKQSIFDDQTSKALKNWRAGVKKKPAAANSKHGGGDGGEQPGSPHAGIPKSEPVPAAGGGVALTQRKNNGETKGEGPDGASAGGGGGSGSKKGEEEFIKLEP